MSRESGSLLVLFWSLWKVKFGMKRQEMTEQTWLLMWWVCLWMTWRASSPGAVWEAEELTACCTHPRNFPTTRRASAGAKGAQGPPGRSHTHSPCASRAPGQVAFLWQGHDAGCRASGVPSNELAPPGLCRRKIIPYSYTIHAKINVLSTCSIPRFPQKVKMRSSQRDFYPTTEKQQAATAYNFSQSFPWLHF